MVNIKKRLAVEKQLKDLRDNVTEPGSKNYGRSYHWARYVDINKLTT